MQWANWCAGTCASPTPTTATKSLTTTANPQTSAFPPGAEQARPKETIIKDDRPPNAGRGPAIGTFTKN